VGYTGRGRRDIGVNQKVNSGILEIGKIAEIAKNCQELKPYH
jgi:hypothetical protein